MRTTSSRSVTAIIWIAVGAAVAASIAFAPMMSVQGCAASVDLAGCSPVQQLSLIGVETNVWLWLGALAIIAVITAVAVRASRGR